MTSQVSVSPQSTWPGERYPSQHDVELANESLEPNFLGSFKRALLSSTFASNNEQLVHVNLETRSREGLTYPIFLLSNFPDLPSDEEITLLQQAFSQRFGKHLLINNLPLLSQSTHHLPPFARLAPASLACTASPSASSTDDQREKGRKLWLAAILLWTVMLEVDNREARTLEGVLTAVLLSIYGMLSADVEVWGWVAKLLSLSTTILRRLRIHESGYSDGVATPSLLTEYKRSSIFSCMLLVNVLSAIHLDLPCYLTSNEVGIHMCSTGVSFQEMYTSLLDDNSPVMAPLLASREDAVLLLAAILSDSICLQRSLGSLLDNTSRRLQNTGSSLPETLPVHNPYPVLSPQSEYRRLSEQLSRALDRWKKRFSSVVACDELPFYYFCRLHLSCSHLPILPRLAGYPPAVQLAGMHKDVGFTEKIFISDESVRYAWAILDHADGQSDADQDLCPIWFPISVFYAGLVVWAKTALQDEASWADIDKPRGLKQLLAFKLELNRMPWPCCVEMASTLDRLVQNGRASVY